MKTRHRSGSIITGCDTEALFVLKNFPVFMMSDKGRDVYCDMKFEIGKEDGFVQLTDIIPPEVLYKDMHSNALGGVWKGAHELVAQIVKSYSNINTRILEIGGATGKLNAIYNQIGGSSRHWDIIEAQPCPVSECTARYIKGMFPDALKNEEKYDMILHTHCMEHMEDLHLFFLNVIKHIVPGGYMIFSVPDMQQMIENRMTSVVNFEHTVLLTEKYIDYMLGNYGFFINEKQHYGNGHSLVYITTYSSEYRKVDLSGMYDLNKTLMLKFYEEHKVQMGVWNEKLRAEQRNCYLFGAHITAQFFECFGLYMERIKAILDNDPKKIGKHVCGVDKEIYAPTVLKDQESSIVILPKTPYADEIQNTILDSINPKVEFWRMD